MVTRMRIFSFVFQWEALGRCPLTHAYQVAVTYLTRCAVVVDLYSALKELLQVRDPAVWSPEHSRLTHGELSSEHTCHLKLDLTDLWHQLGWA